MYSISFLSRTIVVFYVNCLHHNNSQTDATSKRSNHRIFYIIFFVSNITKCKLTTDSHVIYRFQSIKKSNLQAIFGHAVKCNCMNLFAFDSS